MTMLFRETALTKEITYNYPKELTKCDSEEKDNSNRTEDQKITLEPEGISPVSCRNSSIFDSSWLKLYKGLWTRV